MAGSISQLIVLKISRDRGLNYNESKVFHQQNDRLNHFFIEIINLLRHVLN